MLTTDRCQTNANVAQNIAQIHRHAHTFHRDLLKNPWQPVCTHTQYNVRRHKSVVAQPNCYAERASGLDTNFFDYFTSFCFCFFRYYCKIVRGLLVLFSTMTILPFRQQNYGVFSLITFYLFYLFIYPAFQLFRQ